MTKGKTSKEKELAAAVADGILTKTGPNALSIDSERVLAMVAEGKTNEEISAESGLSVLIVKHLVNVLQKEQAATSTDESLLVKDEQRKEDGGLPDGPTETTYGSTEKEALSPREESVLAWVVERKTNWEIARILGVSDRTVRYHLANAYRKLHITSREQAVTLWFKNGEKWPVGTTEKEAPLLVGYITNALSPEEKERLFHAALTDQNLFNALMEDDDLRDALSTNGARQLALRLLQKGGEK